jgi:hypothetical protein
LAGTLTLPARADTVAPPGCRRVPVPEHEPERRRPRPRARATPSPSPSPSAAVPFTGLEPRRPRPRARAPPSPSARATPSPSPSPSAAVPFTETERRRPLHRARALAVLEPERRVPEPKRRRHGTRARSATVHELFLLPLDKVEVQVPFLLPRALNSHTPPYKCW